MYDSIDGAIKSNWMLEKQLNLNLVESKSMSMCSHKYIEVTGENLIKRKILRPSHKLQKSRENKFYFKFWIVSETVLLIYF